MPSNLQPPEASAFLKRTRSADSSNRATPTAERALGSRDALIPAFLRKNPIEIEEQFERLDSKQRQRLEDFRDHPLDSPWTQIASNDTRFRNRYLDIRPWDNSRVRLKVPEGSSDYINASPILLKCSQTGQKRRYIATQGPKESSMEHFWQMVWHETDHYAVVIMLTQLAEGFREKCFQYYPDTEESEPIELSFTNQDGDQLSATLQIVESSWYESSMTMHRTLQLICNNETKLVHHLFFQGWPDYGVPESEDRSALLELIQLSRDKNLGWENPRIVHCSAGVGRTGSFIAIEHLLAELEIGRMDNLAETEDPIFDTIDMLREQRMTMVQSLAQYNFLYELLREAAQIRIKENAIIDKMKDFMTSPSTTSSSEPAQKARKFTTAIRGVFSTIRSRSTSRRPSKRDPITSEDASSRPVSRSTADRDLLSAVRSGNMEGYDSGGSESQTPDIYHDATEEWSNRTSPGRVDHNESAEESESKSPEALPENTVES